MPPKEFSNVDCPLPISNSFPDSFERKKNAGCRSCESSSGIAVDVQQRLNCALPSFSLSSDSLSRFEVFTACPGSDQLIHSADLAVDLFNRSSNLEIRRQ